MLLQFHMSQRRTYEELRREALAWIMPLVSEEISANTTNTNAGCRGGRPNKTNEVRSGGKIQFNNRNKDYHRNIVHNQDNKFKRGKDGQSGQNRNRSYGLKCFNCNKVPEDGHLSKQCPHPCSWCSKPGHSQSVCRSRIAGRPRPVMKQNQGYPSSYTVTLPMPPPPPLPTNTQLPENHNLTTTPGSAVQFNFGSVYRHNPTGALTFIDISSLSTTTKPHTHEIVTDGCATYNLWSNKEDFTEYYQLKNSNLHATSSGGNKMRILGFGAVGGLHHVFHVEGLIKNLVSLAYISNVLKYTYIGVPGKCILYDRDNITPIWIAVVEDDSLLPKLRISDVLNAKLTMPDGSPMLSTPEAMGLSNDSL